MKQKEELKKRRQEYVNPYKPGDIFRTSFGYDMTINRFYQVISVNKKTLKFKDINKEWVSGDIGYTGDVKPIKDDFVSDELKSVTIRIQEWGESIKIDGDYATKIDENQSFYENYMD